MTDAKLLLPWIGIVILIGGVTYLVALSTLVSKLANLHKDDFWKELGSPRLWRGGIEEQATILWRVVFGIGLRDEIYREHALHFVVVRVSLVVNIAAVATPVAMHLAGLI